MRYSEQETIFFLLPMKQHILLLITFLFIFFLKHASAQQTGINKIPEKTLDVHGDIRGDSSLIIGPVSDTDSDSTFIVKNGKVGIGISNPSGQLEVVGVVNIIGSTVDQTSPAGTATASSEYNNDIAARAFDNTSATQWGTPDGITTGWLQYDFGAGNEQVITAYEIREYTNTTAPDNWTFEGSHDAVNWTILDTRMGEGDGILNNQLTPFIIPSNTTAYRYYRINITKNNGNDYVAIVEMALVAENNYTAKREGLRVDSGAVTISGAYTMPTTDGDANQVLLTDGAGNLYWGDDSDITASDIRLKKDFEAIPDVLQKLGQINGYTYHYKDTLGYSSDRQQVGLIAQELQKVLPQLVDTLHKGEDLIGINYAQLTAFLVEVSKAQQAQLADQSALYGSKAMQQDQRMESLEAENAELKAALNNLLKRMEKIEAAAE